MLQEGRIANAAKTALVTCPKRDDEGLAPRRYSIANKTSRTIRYRQKLAHASFPAEVADFDGELDDADAADADAGVVASLDAKSKARGPKETLVAARQHAARGGLVVRASDDGDDALDDGLSSSKAVSSSKSSSGDLSTQFGRSLERTASSMRDVVVGGAASAVFGASSSSAKPEKKQSMSADVIASAEKAAKYLGKKVRSGAKKMGVIAKPEPQQRAGPWRRLEKHDTAAYFVAERIFFPPLVLALCSVLQEDGTDA